jgi:hypothetical protein
MPAHAPEHLNCIVDCSETIHGASKFNVSHVLVAIHLIARGTLGRLVRDTQTGIVQALDARNTTIVRRRGRNAHHGELPDFIFRVEGYANAGKHFQKV